MNKTKIIHVSISACLLLILGVVAASSMYLLNADQSGIDNDSDTSDVTSEDDTGASNDNQDTVDTTDPSGVIQIKLNGNSI